MLSCTQLQKSSSGFGVMLTAQPGHWSLKLLLVSQFVSAGEETSYSKRWMKFSGKSPF